VRSEEFDNASWTKSNASITANSISAPSGAATADTLIEDTATNTHLVQISGLSVTSGTAYTLSCYAKPAGRNFIQLLLTGGFVSNVQAIVDLTNGTVGATLGSPVVTVTSLANGWYRVSITATAILTTTTTVQIRVASNSASGFYQGDGTSGIYIWGAQLEAGAFPTSYISTTTATATRAADVVSITGSAFSSWYRQDEGTMFAEGRRDGTADGRFLGLSTGSISNTYVLTTSAARNGVISSVSGGSFGGGVTTANVFAYQNAIKLAATLSTSLDESLCLNGGTVATGNMTAPIGTLTTLDIGTQSGASTAFFNGTIRRLTYWPQRLSNPTLQAITQ
jgi:hypothetical protein